jgi:hypothetical protein
VIALATNLIAASLLALVVGCASGPRTRTIVWDPLPFPKDFNWTGSRGAPATIEKGDLILQGQEVSSRGTYRKPLTIECDFLLEKRVAGEGALIVRFLPPDQPTDATPKQLVQFELVYRGETNVTFIQRCDGSVRCKTVWGEEAVILKDGEPNHLKLEILSDGMRFAVNGQTFEASGVTVPYDKFHVRLWSWEPMNRWHVSNFVVR